MCPQPPRGRGKAKSTFFLGFVGQKSPEVTPNMSPSIGGRGREKSSFFQGFLAKTALKCPKKVSTTPEGLRRENPLFFPGFLGQKPPKLPQNYPYISEGTRKGKNPHFFRVYWPKTALNSPKKGRAGATRLSRDCGRGKGQEFPKIRPIPGVFRNSSPALFFFFFEF